jgi:membrane associated rhomboid family serine protease
MAESPNDLLEVILRDCATISPEPWYPAEFAKATGIPRPVLDPYLDQLRLAGLVRLTDWVAGHGQGYAVTPGGEEVLQSPRLLAQLRQGQLAPRTAEAETGQPSTEVPRSEWDRAEVIRQDLLRPGTARVTIAILLINLLVFLIGLGLGLQAGLTLDDFLLHPERLPNILHQTGAISRLDVSVHHEWWRLLSCCFVHIGLLHLAVNMYFLYQIGPLVERMWGEARFLLSYVIAGVCGSCAMVTFELRGPVIGAGASGALFGTMGSMAMWIALNRRYLPRELASGWMRQLLIVFLLNVAITHFSGLGISAAGHYGGAIAGAAVAVPLHFLRWGHGVQRGLAVVGLVAVPAIFFALMVRSFNEEDVRIDLLLQEVQRQAELARRQEKLNELAPRERAEMQDQIMPKVQKRERAALKVFEENIDFSGEKPPQPKKKTPKEAATALEKVCDQELTDAIRILRAAGPYQNQVPEQARQARLKVFEARFDLYRLTARLLKGEEPWDQARWEMQNQRLAQAEADWKSMLQR